MLILGWPKSVDDQMYVWISGGNKLPCGVADGPSHARQHKVWFTMSPVTQIFEESRMGNHSLFGQVGMPAKCHHRRLVSCSKPCLLISLMQLESSVEDFGC